MTLVTARRLAEMLRAGAEAPAVLDVRWDVAAGPRRDRYEQGHVPGAAFVNLDAELAAPPGAGGRHPLPSIDVFQRAMRSAGVSDNRSVVVYDQATSTAAARAWWLLRYCAHPAVSVLDGGIDAWIEHGLALQRGPGAIPAIGDFTARPGGMDVLDAVGAARVAATGVLLDARAPERFRGENEPIDPVAGHIPGARNLPATDNVDGSGRFLAAQELRERFAELGAEPGIEVGAYCGSGVTAAHEVLAAELAGLSASLYAGSWSEWITDPQRSVALGE